MVATRSQEPVVTNGGLDDSVTANGNPKEEVRKRKAADEQEVTKIGEARKRKKRADFFERTPDQKRDSQMNDGSVTQGARQSLSPESMQESEDSVDFHASPKAVESPDTSAIDTSEDVSLEPEEQRILSADEVDKVASKPEVAVVVQTQVKQPEFQENIGVGPLAPAKGKSKSLKTSEASTTIPHHPETPSKSASEHKSTHKRFNSVEPEQPIATEEPAVTTTGLAVKEIDECSDSDAAPEITTLAAATSEVKASRSSAADAARTQKQQKRQKAKEHEESRRLQLKIQQAKSLKASRKEKRREDLAAAAMTSTPPLSMTPPPTASTTLKGSPVYDKISHHSRKMEIPKVLSMDILSSVPAVRPPTPPPEASSISHRPEKKSTCSDVQKQTNQRKHVILSAEKKPPKDIVKNGIRLRMLQEEGKRTLAPKAAKHSKMLREHWLSGRGAVERRPWGAAATGFVRAN